MRLPYHAYPSSAATQTPLGRPSSYLFRSLKRLLIEFCSSILLWARRHARQKCELIKRVTNFLVTDRSNYFPIEVWGRVWSLKYRQLGYDFHFVQFSTTHGQSILHATWKPNIHRLKPIIIWKQNSVSIKSFILYTVYSMKLNEVYCDTLWTRRRSQYDPPPSKVGPSEEYWKSTGVDAAFLQSGRNSRPES